MKKIIGIIAIIISFAILANTHVSASTLESSQTNKDLLSKKELIQILDASQSINLNIDLAPIALTMSIEKADIKIAKNANKTLINTNQKVTADE